MEGGSKVKVAHKSAASLRIDPLGGLLSTNEIIALRSKRVKPDRGVWCTWKEGDGNEKGE